jgi:hypothetical protein
MSKIGPAGQIAIFLVLLADCAGISGPPEDPRRPEDKKSSLPKKEGRGLGLPLEKELETVSAVRAGDTSIS